MIKNLLKFNVIQFNSIQFNSYYTPEFSWYNSLEVFVLSYPDWGPLQTQTPQQHTIGHSDNAAIGQYGTLGEIPLGLHPNPTKALAAHYNYANTVDMPSLQHLHPLTLR